MKKYLAILFTFACTGPILVAADAERDEMRQQFFDAMQAETQTALLNIARNPSQETVRELVLTINRFHNIYLQARQLGRTPQEAQDGFIYTNPWRSEAQDGFIYTNPWRSVDALPGLLEDFQEVIELAAGDEPERLITERVTIKHFKCCANNNPVSMITIRNANGDITRMDIKTMANGRPQVHVLPPIEEV